MRNVNGRRRVARTVAVGACATLLVVGWYFLAPRQMGGRAAYVTTAGTSMEPLLHQGDLALVYPSATYQVGDVVAYRNPDIHQVVLHRIVALDGDRLVLQGDNNTWLDAYRPGRDQVLGEMAVRVPGLGRPLAAVRTPWGMSALLSLAALGVFGGRRRRKTNRELASAEREDAPAVRARAERPPGSRSSTRIPAGVPTALGVVAVVALAVGVVLIALPATSTAEHDVTFQERGAFSYSAPLTAKGVAVYGRDRIETGDPVYLELTDEVTVRFDYGFETAAVAQLAGTSRMVGEISDVNGWTRSFDLAPASAFDGTVASVEGVLELPALQAMVATVERLTGVARDHYTVTLRPEVAVEGTLAGRPVERTFAPELRFFLDPLQLQLEPVGAAPVGEEVADPLNPVVAGNVTSRTTGPRTLSLLGVEVRLEPLRVAALVTLLVSLAGLGAVAFARLRSARRGEPAVIEARYGQFLVPVRAASVPSAPGRTVQVESFDSLVRLANHYGHVVLHEEGDGFHAYSVEENGVTYRYLARNGARP
jgi:signal peptidase I